MALQAQQSVRTNGHSGLPSPAGSGLGPRGEHDVQQLTLASGGMSGVAGQNVAAVGGEGATWTVRVIAAKPGDIDVESGDPASPREIEGVSAVVAVDPLTGLMTIWTVCDRPD